MREGKNIVYITIALLSFVLCVYTGTKSSLFGEMMNYYVYLILTVNTYLFKYVPVKLGFIILSLIGVLRIPEEFYLYKDKDKWQTLGRQECLGNKVIAVRC